MNYVATVRNSNKQIRISVSCKKLSADKSKPHFAVAQVVGTDEIIARSCGKTAGEALFSVEESIRQGYDYVETYERAKHHHLSLGKLIKR